MYKIISICFILLIPTHIFAATDQYLTGYVNSILKQKYSVSLSAEVRGGELFLPADIMDEPDYKEIISEISLIEGIRSVKLTSKDETENISKVWIFPDDSLFKPLIADLRWPRFSAAWHRYTHKNYTENEFEASFGSTVPLFKTAAESFLFEVGVQGGVVTVFDFDTPSDDIVNIDYMVGIPVVFRWDRLSLLVRFYHVSTHLGDEFIIKHPDVERVNLSYETLNVTVSYEFEKPFRLYAGGDYIPDPDPGSYGNWGYLAGIEVYPEINKLPKTVAALHIKGGEFNGYKPAYSVKIGAQVFSKIFLAFDFYDGHSPNGQFFDDKITYCGFSLAFISI